MSTMVPEYDNGAFETYQDAHGETTVMPAGTLSPAELDRLDLSLVDHTLGKWYCRLQMPGYLDATEWEGPFATEAEARTCIEDAFDVDPDTGEERP